MSNNLSPYKVPYKFMSDFVKQKYALLVRQTIESVKISPKNYKDKTTLNKTWFVYFWYKTNGNKRKFEKATISIDGLDIQINRVKDHKLKVEYIQILKNAIIQELKTEPKFILKLIYGNDKAYELYPSLYELAPKPEKKTISIKDAFNEVLDTKKNLSHTYYGNLKSIVNRFYKFLGSDIDNSTKLLSKKIIIQFLNSDTSGKSERNYNNVKTQIKLLLEVLKDLEYIDRNFLDGVKNKKTKSVKNRALTQSEIKKLFDKTKKVDIELYYYLLHIYYGLMRPQTINRVKVEHIDLERKMFLTDTKTGEFLKLIPVSLINEFYSKQDLTNKSGYVFAQNKLFADWNTEDNYRRNHYTKRFFNIKKALFEDYKIISMYSLRHSGIVQIFENKSKELKESGVMDYKNKAVEYIMPITNHKTREQTKEYLRGISTEMHEDWSKYF